MRERLREAQYLWGARLFVYRCYVEDFLERMVTDLQQRLIP